MSRIDRRTAVKIFGVLLACLAGHPIARAEEVVKLTAKTPRTRPMSYHFSEKGMGDIMIERKDGSEFSFPFSDIVDALKEPTIDWKPVKQIDGKGYPFMRSQSLELGARSDGVVVWRKVKKL